MQLYTYVYSYGVCRAFRFKRSAVVTHAGDSSDRRFSAIKMRGGEEDDYYSLLSTRYVRTKIGIKYSKDKIY